MDAESARWPAWVRRVRRLAGRIRHWTPWPVIVALRRWAVAPIDRVRHRVGPVAVVCELDLLPGRRTSMHHRPLFAGAGRRWATTGSAAWLSDTTLVSVNLVQGSLSVFDFDSSGTTPTLRRRHLYRGIEGVKDPTCLGVSPDRRWLAITNSGHGTVTVLSTDGLADGRQPRVVASARAEGDRNVHEVTFTPDQRHVMWSSIDRPGGLRWCEFSAADGQVRLGPVHWRDNERSPLKVKGIDIDPDGRFVALSYGINAARRASRHHRGAVEVASFDPATCTVGPVISRLADQIPLACGEDLTYVAGGSLLAVVGHFEDQVLLVHADPVTGRLGGEVGRIGRSAGGLRTPHGVLVSPDQRWLLVASYGDASVKVFEVSAIVASGRR